jgi:hypothetical protein
MLLMTSLDYGDPFCYNLPPSYLVVDSVVVTDTGVEHIRKVLLDHGFRGKKRRDWWYRDIGQPQVND